VNVSIHSNKGGDIRFRSDDFDVAHSIVGVNGNRIIPTTEDGVCTLTGIHAGDVVEVLFNTLIGDVNNDGFVTITDAIALVNIILGKAEKVAAADINGDGLVTITDVIALVNIILEKKTP
jgi:hypothetical protein